MGDKLASNCVGALVYLVR